ncbi:response regulator [Streptomyces sp. NPDC000963]|uniref:response regulator n=1 Tax=unclassified Streptomyces TaxID=2593676 RepID=UPI000F782841|nr:response regulator [Streptomyces sp. WAC08241]MYV67150.1 response regulator [Streptomyces sp. SID2131]RSS37234.1 response regulator [Streptomyces sp. WAC08241]
MNRVPETTDARPTTPDRILVVEDSPEDAEAIERALRRTHPDLALEFADRGEGLVEALLSREDLPGLILLDLNMPGTGGQAVLERIRSRPELDAVTVVVFTSSTAPAEVDACYAAGADSYVYKPVNFTLFQTVLKGAVDYWRQAGSGADAPSVK